MLNTVLKGIIAFVLLSVLYGLYIGLTNKSDEIITEVEIEAPPELVYEYITDPEKSKEWLTGLQSVELVSGDSLVVGSEYKLVFVEGKREMVIRETLTYVKPNEQFAFKIEDDFLTGHVDITLRPTEDGTFVREVNTYSGNSFISRMILGLAKRSIKRGKQDMYENLEDICEKF